MGVGRRGWDRAGVDNPRLCLMPVYFRMTWQETPTIDAWWDALWRVAELVRSDDSLCLTIPEAATTSFGQNILLYHPTGNPPPHLSALNLTAVVCTTAENLNDFLVVMTGVYTFDKLSMTIHRSETGCSVPIQVTPRYREGKGPAAEIVTALGRVLQKHTHTRQLYVRCRDVPVFDSWDDALNGLPDSVEVIMEPVVVVSPDHRPTTDNKYRRTVNCPGCHPPCGPEYRCTGPEIIIHLQTVYI